MIRIDPDLRLKIYSCKIKYPRKTAAWEKTE